MTRGYSSKPASELRPPPRGPAPGAVPQPSRPDPFLTEKRLWGKEPPRSWTDLSTGPSHRGGWPVRFNLFRRTRK